MVRTINDVPELPEVEILRRQLKSVVGKTVVKVDTRGERWSDANELVDAQVEKVERRGKYLLFTMSLDRTMREFVVHLGMTGVLNLYDSDVVVERYRMIWTFDDTTRLVLGDVRGFGRAVWNSADITGLQQLGPEPLDGFDLDAYAKSLNTKTAPVKAVILGQRLMAGVGNYVADEGLWRAQVHPEESELSVERAHLLGQSLIAVMAEALTRGGVSMRDYQHLDGERGEMQDALKCYGRAGLPCLRCETALQKSVVAGRGSTWCAVCQTPPANGIQRTMSS